MDTAPRDEHGGDGPDPEHHESGGHQSEQLDAEIHAAEGHEAEGHEPDDPEANDHEPDEQPDDDESEQHEPPEGSDPLRFNNWMKRSATGAVLTGISLGLREALQPTKNEPAFMIEASGEPEDPDNPIQLHFDPDSPQDTVAYIRRPTAPSHPEDRDAADPSGPADGRTPPEP